MILIIPVLVLFFTAILTQHTAWIEILVYPYLLNHGFLPYNDLVLPYGPLFIWFLQIIESVFGYSPLISLALTIFLGFINIALIYIVVNKISNKKDAAFLASLFYAVWFFYFEGNGLWFELFQTPFIVLSYYFFYSFINLKKSLKNLIFSSIFVFLSIYIKQSTIWIVLVYLGWLILINLGNFKKIVLHVALFLVPFVLLTLLISLIAFLGNYFNGFFYWVFNYTFLQFPFSPGHSDFPSLTELLKLLVPISFLMPFVILYFNNKKRLLFSLLFLTACFMSVLPRWGLFHLQGFLAMLSVISSDSALVFLKDKNKLKRSLVIVCILIWVVVLSRQFVRFINKPIRFFEPEVYKTAEYLKQKNYLDFYVYNSFDQLYVLTNTVPKVKPYVQNFAWYMEIPGVQESIVNGLKKSQTKYIVFSPFSGRGGYGIGDYVPQILDNYIMGSYKLVDTNGRVLVLKKR